MICRLCSNLSLSPRYREQGTGGEVCGNIYDTSYELEDLGAIVTSHRKPRGVTRAKDVIHCMSVERWNVGTSYNSRSFSAKSK